MVLIFSTPWRSLRASNAETMLFSSATVWPRRAGSRAATKPEMSANRIEASAKLSAIGSAGLSLEPLDDAVGQDVAQERVGLGLGGLGEAEGIEDGGGDEAERRDGGLGVERVEERRGRRR